MACWMSIEESNGRGKRYRSCERLPPAPLRDQLVILTTPCGGTMESRCAAERRPAMRDPCAMETSLRLQRTCLLRACLLWTWLLPATHQPTRYGAMTCCPPTPAEDDAWLLIGGLVARSMLGHLLRAPSRT